MKQIDVSWYFAYGTNMSTQRLRERIPEARYLGIAVLEDYEFRCNKKSKDDSSKGNIIPEKYSVTWGVVYEIPKAALAALDRAEGGYDRITVSVTLKEKAIDCETYRSDDQSSQLPYDWYMTLIIDGAREHNLPDEYVQMLSEIPVKADDRENG